MRKQVLWTYHLLKKIENEFINLQTILLPLILRRIRYSITHQSRLVESIFDKSF